MFLGEMIDVATLLLKLKHSTHFQSVSASPGIHPSIMSASLFHMVEAWHDTREYHWLMSTLRCSWFCLTVFTDCAAAGRHGRLCGSAAGTDAGGDEALEFSVNIAIVAGEVLEENWLCLIGYHIGDRETDMFSSFASLGRCGGACTERFSILMFAWEVLE